MGKLDISAKKFMSDSDRFADAFNYIMPDGWQVEAKDFKELDTNLFEIPYGINAKEPVQRVRDLVRSMIIKYDDRAVYVIGGLENESKVNYAMPVKALILDMLNYTKQIREAEKSYKKQKEYGVSNSEFLSGFHKEDKLIPVITLTIHFGNQKWDGPRNIREMFSETDPRIMRFLPDYEINLISPNEIDDFSDFDSDLGVVLSYIKASVDKKELRDLTSSDERFRRVERDAFHVLNEATDSKLKMIVKEGKIDVCTAIKEIREEGREEGRQEGAMAERERVALNMLRESGPAISVSFIAKMTGFSEDEVMDLAKENGIDLV